MRSYFSKSWAVFSLIILTGCIPYEEEAAERFTNPDYDYWATTSLARQVLGNLQEVSFRQNREYCGYIGLDGDGNLRATPATKGRPSSCLAEAAPADWTLVASYHTHGAYARYADAEVPSESDLMGDFEEQVNGYVSTPGGRFWHINGAEQRTTLICGPGCLPADPLYVPDPNVASSYTLQQLGNR